MAMGPAAHQGRGLPYRNPLSVDDMIGLHNILRSYLRVSLTSKTFIVLIEYLRRGTLNIETTEPPEIVVLAERGSLRR